MSYATILYDKQDGVATITLNRPDALNAFTPEMNKELLDALKDGDRDKEIRCFVLTGAGERAFCAGQDLKGRSPDKKGSLGESLRVRYNPIILAIRRTEKPVVCAVNGVAAGAGCNLTLACDMRIAADNARFIEAFVRVGLGPDCGGSYFMPRLIGLSKAMEMFLLGEPLSAEDALRYGLVARVVPIAKLAQETRTIAERLAPGTRRVGLIKRAMNRSMYAELEGQLEYEAYIQEIAGQTKDYDEGVVAFMEKRPPVFKGE